MYKPLPLSGQGNSSLVMIDIQYKFKLNLEELFFQEASTSMLMSQTLNKKHKMCLLTKIWNTII